MVHSGGGGWDGSVVGIILEVGVRVSGSEFGDASSCEWG